MLLERQGAWREALGRKDPDYKLLALAITQTNLMAHCLISRVLWKEVHAWSLVTAASATYPLVFTQPSKPTLL